MTHDERIAKARQRWDEFENPDRHRVLFGTGTCGLAAGAAGVLEVVRGHLAANGLDVPVGEVGCLGLCYAEPMMELQSPGAPRILYGGVSRDNVAGILDAYFSGDVLGAGAAIAVMAGEPVDGIPPFSELPMLHGQVRAVMRNCGVIDPADLDHYLARDGYLGLRKALDMSPEAVIEEVQASGLRGRGGAGFPTGVKWEFCRKMAESPKYLVCNADEGDPGAFMDRSLIESDPHAVVEGMAIAAYAIGATHGYIYIRAEYPLAVHRLEQALEQAAEAGLLGREILGSGFDFEVRLKKGAGAFVCGEETALLASIEGRRGTPRPRPPFPAQSGLFGCPTNINNVETLANVPLILREGHSTYAARGTDDSRGTKTFALAGKINRTGLIEVPFGITLREVIFDIGGGIPDGRDFKAVQTGGPSGGCIPADLLDLPVDYGSLAEIGAIMGSGGMIVMDEDTCIVDIARYFTDFTREESCGKCVPCRLGTSRMHGMLKDITEGRATVDDLALLEEIAESIKVASLCGLGQTAPNPVLTTLEYFRDEYVAHVCDRTCPGGVCLGLARFVIVEDVCCGCGACVRACPADAIQGERKQPHVIDQSKCVRCGACEEACKFDAVTRE